MANVIPKTCANLETSLATAISSSAASLTAASITTDDGVVLPSGTYGITVDQGTNQQEHMIVSFAGTTVGTIVTRGVSVIDGTTNIPALQFAHARGASIKFTDHPVLIRLLRVLQGTDTLDSKLSYTSHPTFSSNTELIDKKYADDLAIAGAPDASTIVKGILEAATSAELAAGTATGATGALLAATGASFNATSSAAVLVPVTNASGKLSAGFGGAASSLATLNGSSKVVEDPANATSTPTASKIPIADSNGKLDGWISATTNNSLTTGEAIDGSTTPQVVCVAAADGLIYKADANTSTRVNAYGFITTNALISTTPVVKVAGILRGFSGLTIGAEYYVTDTAGSISTTPSTTCQIPVGRAISATEIELCFGKKVAFATITHSAVAGATDDQTITVGFQPALVTMNVLISNAGSSTNLAKGVASFNTTSAWKSICLSYIDNAGTAITSNNITTFIENNVATTPYTLEGTGGNRSRITWSINSISSTGFVSRMGNQTIAGAGGTGTSTITCVIYE